MSDQEFSINPHAFTELKEAPAEGHGEKTVEEFSRTMYEDEMPLMQEEERKINNPKVSSAQHHSKKYKPPNIYEPVLQSAKRTK